MKSDWDLVKVFLRISPEWNCTFCSCNLNTAAREFFVRAQLSSALPLCLCLKDLEAEARR